jgi:hypothetical protein
LYIQVRAKGRFLLWSGSIYYQARGMSDTHANPNPDTHANPNTNAKF